MPGPLLTVNISETVRRGFWAGPAVVLGHAITEFAVVVLLAVGLSRLLGGNFIRIAIGLLGGVVLVWMGYSSLTSLQQSQLVLTDSGASAAVGAAPVIAGITASLANPYWVLWWGTVGATYVVWSLKSGAIGLASFYGGHILSDASWYTFVSLIIVTGRRLLSETVYTGLLAACGVFLVGFGGYFIYSAVRILVRGASASRSESS
jgi:threonine/homoserine/homoserine lactone efflux protein